MEKNKIVSTPKHQNAKVFPVLLVEDNPVSRKLLEKTLNKAGYDVTSVEDGREALDLFNNTFFPILVTDWMMPEMDGLELCQAIRENTKSSGYVYIIILTGKDAKDNIIEGLEAGADDYLTKPFNQSELIARLNTADRVLELEKSLLTANEKIRLLSITDPLTNCFNRYYMNERLSQEIKRAKRYRMPLSVVMSDIDHFKKVNDTYGHQAGDQVLKEFVACIKDTIRNDIDWVARYGGEEFLIVLPETDVNSACIVTERIRHTISEKVMADETGIQITASFGVSGFGDRNPDKTIAAEDMLNEADKYLYKSKREGRNKVSAGI